MLPNRRETGNTGNPPCHPTRTPLLTFPTPARWWGLRVDGALRHRACSPAGCFRVPAGFTNWPQGRAWGVRRGGGVQSHGAFPWPAPAVGAGTLDRTMSRSVSSFACSFSLVIFQSLRELVPSPTSKNPGEPTRGALTTDVCVGPAVVRPLVVRRWPSEPRCWTQAVTLLS